MGLDTTHNCWHGSYSSFNRFREKLAECCGFGNLTDYVGFGGLKDFPENELIVILLHHSDCEGEIKWEDCKPISERMAIFVPAMKNAGYELQMKKWIDGLNCAHQAKESVVFQ